jgi:hypothetical protein
MAFNLSGAFANSAGAFDRIRKGINEEEDRDRAAKIRAGLGEIDNAVDSGAIPTPNSAPTDTAVPTTQDFSQYITQKLSTLDLDPDQRRKFLDQTSMKMFQKFQGGMNKAAMLADAGRLDQASDVMKAAYAMMPNNTRLEFMPSPKGLVVRGVVEEDDHRGPAGTGTGGTIIQNGQQIRDMMSKFTERPELFRAMSIPMLQAQANLEKTRAGNTHTKAATKAQQLANDVFDKITESKLDYQAALTEHTKANARKVGVDADLAPMRVANDYLNITNQHTREMWRLNKKVAKGLGWNDAAINTLQKSMDKADTARDKLFKLQTTNIRKGVDADVRDVLDGLMDEADLNDEQLVAYDKAKADLDKVTNDMTNAAQTAVLRQENLGEFLRLNPSPSNGGSLGTTYEGIIGAAGQIMAKDGKDVGDVIKPFGSGVLITLGNNRVLNIKPTEDGNLEAYTGLISNGTYKSNHRKVGVPSSLLSIFSEFMERKPPPTQSQAANTTAIPTRGTGNQYSPRELKMLAEIKRRKVEDEMRTMQHEADPQGIPDTTNFGT